MKKQEVVIPTTIKAATKALEGIDSLLTAKGWERAAIVYAYTENEGRGRPAKNREKSLFSISGFAALGITGLADQHQVAKYRNAWADAIALGKAVEVEPGDSVVIPDLDFPPMRTGTDGYNTVAGAKRTISKMDPEVRTQALSELASEDPDVAETVVETVIANPDLHDEAERRMPKVKTPKVPGHERNIDDCYADIETVLGHMDIDMGEAIRLMEEAIQKGWNFGDLEWAALAQTPGLVLQESFIEFGKLVAMIEIDKARI